MEEINKVGQASQIAEVGLQANISILRMLFQFKNDKKLDKKPKENSTENSSAKAAIDQKTVEKITENIYLTLQNIMRDEKQKNLLLTDVKSREKFLQISISMGFREIAADIISKCVAAAEEKKKELSAAKKKKSKDAKKTKNAKSKKEEKNSDEEEDENSVEQLSTLLHPKNLEKFPSISSVTYQLTTASPHLKRPEGVAADPRVPFKPDMWQEVLLNVVDAKQSALVVAPTSSGKKKKLYFYFCGKKIFLNFWKKIIFFG